VTGRVWCSGIRVQLIKNGGASRVLFLQFDYVDCLPAV
jgi:hypothetical protein